MSLDTFIPEVRHLEISGRSVTAAPLKVRQIPPFARAIGPSFAALAQNDLALAIGLHGESLIDAMAIATGQPAEWLGELDADEFMRIVADVVEVNAGFFAHRVSPLLMKLTEKMTQTLMQTTPGPMP